MQYWGYVRVSVDRETQAAGWEDQISKLNEFGVSASDMHLEEASTRGNRPVFDEMLARANREATSEKRVCIIATKMDRAFRDLAAADASITNPVNPNVIWLLPDLSKQPLDPTDPTQMLLVRMMGAVAQFERDRLAERRAYGIAKAKAEGRYKGRKPTARAKAPEVLKLKEQGLKPSQIAKVAEIGVASVYRILAEERQVQVS